MTEDNNYYYQYILRHTHQGLGSLHGDPLGPWRHVAGAVKLLYPEAVPLRIHGNQSHWLHVSERGELVWCSLLLGTHARPVRTCTY